MEDVPGRQRSSGSHGNIADLERRHSMRLVGDTLTTSKTNGA
jgi:hypothetical protein